MAKKYLPLIRITTPTESRVHLVDRLRFSIGRSPDAEIILLSPSISRKHLLVEIQGDQIYVEDLQSANGSFVHATQLKPKERVPVDSNTPIRLGTSAEVLKIELIERPVEFEKFESYLPQFNQNILSVMTGAVQTQVNSLMENAKVEAQRVIEAARLKAAEESQELKAKALEQVRKYGAEKLEIVKAELTQMRETGLAELTTEIAQQKERMLSQIPASTREIINDLKIKAQVEADQILQKAHKDLDELRQAELMKAEQAKADAQKRCQALVADAEAESSKLLNQAREVSEQMRQKCRADVTEMMDSAKIRVATLIEQQDREMKTTLAELREKIEREGQLANRNLIDSAMIEAKLKIAELEQAFQIELTKLSSKKQSLQDLIAKQNSEQDWLLQKKASAEKELAELTVKVQNLTIENQKQISLSEDIARAEAKFKSIELATAQLSEKNTRSETDLDLLKRKTFEELDLARVDATKKLAQMFSSKAQELAGRMEKLIISQITEFSPGALDGSKLHSVSQKLSEELTHLFKSEIIPLESADLRLASDSNLKKSFVSSKLFRWSAAASAIALLVFLIKTSSETVQDQVQFTEKLIEQKKEESQYKPQMNKDYRQTYTDNILFKEQYVEMKLDNQLQDQWALNLNEFFVKELKLNEESMVRFIGMETKLIKQLVVLRSSVEMKYLEEGLKRMQDAEAAETANILTLLKSQKNYEKLRLREKIFLSQVKQVNLRNPAAK